MARLPASSESHQQLRRHGLLPSKTRVAIYEWLTMHPVHPNVDTVFSALRPDFPTLSRTTVYNVLHAFVEKGLAEKVRSEDGELRYDGNPSAHAHFKCLQCGALTDLATLPETLPETLGLPKGFQTHTTAVTVWGRCASCAEAHSR